MTTLRVDAPPFTRITATADDGAQLETLVLGNERLGAEHLDTGSPALVAIIPHPADPTLTLTIPGPSALASHLSRQHTCLFPAPRYSGRSDARGPIRLSRLAADVATCIEAALPQDNLPVLLWAHRLGGVIALELARRFPHLVAGLVLDSLIIDPALLDLFGGAPSRYDRLPAAAREDAVHEVVTSSFQSNFQTADPNDVAALVDDFLAVTPPQIVAQSYREVLHALQTPTRLTDLYRVEQPVLLLVPPPGVDVPGDRADFTMLRRFAANAEIRNHPTAAAMEQAGSQAVHGVVMDWWNDQTRRGQTA